PRKSSEQHIGHDQTKHVVAEEFKPLIARSTVAGERRDMAERLLKQRRVLEAVADALLEFRGVSPPPFALRRSRRTGGYLGLVAARWRQYRRLGTLALWRAAHRRTRKKRLRRNAHGQRQICQAAAPSPIEK